MIPKTLYQNLSVLELSCTCNVQSFEKDKCSFRGHHGHYRMVVGFTTTYAISVYHH